MPATQRLLRKTLQAANMEVGLQLSAQWELLQKYIGHSTSMMQAKDDILQVIHVSDIEIVTESHACSFITSLRRCKDE